MISDKMAQAINDQINRELYSEYLYMAMAACFEAANLKGFAHWMIKQAEEEHTHAMKMYEYMCDQGARVKLQAIQEPPFEWATPLAGFEAVLEHEKHVTAAINKLVELAIEEKDHATEIFYQWFVTEQVEEEATAQGIVETLKLVGDSPMGILMVDRQLAQR